MDEGRNHALKKPEKKMLYKEQFGNKEYVFDVLTQQRAEEVAAWMIAHGTSWAETDYDAPKVPYINYKGNHAWDRHQHTLETKLKDKFIDAFPDLYLNYDEYDREAKPTGGNRWATCVNTVMSNWDGWARVHSTVHAIRTTEMPEKIREFLLARYEQHGDVDIRNIEKFNSDKIQLSSGEKVDAYCFSTKMLCYGNQINYVYIDKNGDVRATDQYYSIGE